MAVPCMGSTYRLLRVTFKCHKATYDITDALWRHPAHGLLGDISNEDLAIGENNQFTSSIEQLSQMKYSG